MANKLEKFIKKCIKRHSNKYDYSKVEYVDSLTKVCIICPEHGEFWQTPQSHVRGNGCPECANIKRANAIKSNGEDFIKKANIIHKWKYKYNPELYVNATTKITITCPEHGDFTMTPMAHLAGQGCPKCAGRGLTTEEVVALFKKVHGDKYDYSKVKFDKMHTKVCIICPEHGEFWQTPSKHAMGQGCPECALAKRSARKRLTTKEFIEKAIKIHGNEYVYDKTEYTGTYDSVIITCKKHGDFSQRANDHLNGHGCPICGNNLSLAEINIREYIKSLGYDVVEKDRTILDNKEIDLFVPSASIGVEYDGLYWHSDEFKDKKYHLNKTEECAKLGIRLIHIFEDEWVNKNNIIKSMLSNILNKTPIKIYARNCIVKEVSKDEKKAFLDENHIQGNIGAQINIGLYFDNQLVSLMCFGKPRVNLGRKDIKEGEYELLRFCNKLFTSVIGGASKLFKHFINEYKPNTITSYCDRRWSVGNMYENLGFTLSHKSEPNYFYVVGNNRKNRFKYRKSELIKEGFDPRKSETEIMNERGIHKIYDCGTLVYKWHEN